MLLYQEDSRPRFTQCDTLRTSRNRTQLTQYETVPKSPLAKEINRDTRLYSSTLRLLSEHLIEVIKPKGVTNDGNI